MPQLENLQIVFLSYPISSCNVEGQLVHMPIMIRATLPNLRCFQFDGGGAYMEAVLCQITAPRLERVRILIEQPAFSVPSLLQIISTTENLRFDCADFTFSNLQVYVSLYLSDEAKVHTLSKVSMTANGWPLDEQVSSVVQIFNCPRQIFSTVERLTLKRGGASDNRDEADRTKWRKLLRSFSNVKTLCVNDGLVKEISRCLRLDDGERPLELLPELQELLYHGREGDTADALTSFIDTRRNAGNPVTLDFPRLKE
jgi:hypothetical protein